MRRRIADRIVDLDAARARVEAWRAGGKRVVFANGVFDLLHVGHARYLQGAAALGDRLVVGVNGDRAAAGLKGRGRPVLPAFERAALVAALRGVDLVVVFDEPTADAIIAALRPDVHAKGTDYTTETVPERAAVRAAGGTVAIAGDPKGHASRDLIEHIKARVRGGG